MAGTKKVDFTTGPMGKNIVYYTVPLLVTSVVQHLFGTADMVVMGKFVGDAAQAAVSSTGTLTSLMITLLVGLSQGVRVLVAQCVGAKDSEKAARVVHTAIATALSVGTALGIACIAATPYVLRWMQYPAAIEEQARIYMSIYFLGLPIQLLYNCAGASLSAQGDSRRPMYFLLLGGALNVVLNLIMVLGFGMGVSGVAWATVVSNGVSAWLTIRCINHDAELFHLELAKLRIHLPTLKEIARLGVPGAITSSAFNLSGVLVQSSINSLGDVVVTASGAAGNLNTYINSVLSAIYSTCIILCAQNIGAKRIDRVKKGYRQCMRIAVGSAVVLSLLLLVIGPVLLQMYTDSPEVIREGMVRMRCILPLYFLQAIMLCAQGAQQGLGFAGGSSLITMIGTCGLRVLWVFFVFPLYPRHVVLVLCYPAGWAVTGLAHCIRLRWIFRRLTPKEEAPAV